jgi:hypothetical protein
MRGARLDHKAGAAARSLMRANAAMAKAEPRSLMKTKGDAALTLTPAAILEMAAQPDRGARPRYEGGHLDRVQYRAARRATRR